MTLKEIKEAIDEYIGLDSVIEGSECDVRLVYYSPNHVELFHFMLSSGESGFQFGGASQVLPHGWQDLCRIGNVYK